MGVKMKIWKILMVSILSLLVLALSVVAVSDMKLHLRDLKDKMPHSYNEVKEKVHNADSVYKFEAWTYNRKNTITGKYANGYFYGLDNNKKHVFGVYDDDHFAGYQNDHFFKGIYGNGYWKAKGLFSWLFDSDRTSGKYITWQ